MFMSNNLIFVIIKNANLGQIIKFFFFWYGRKITKFVFIMLSVSLFEFNQLDKLFSSEFTIYSNVLRFS